VIDLRQGDCLEVMKTIKSGSIDAIITDPPYGTTACKWDSVINFELMWEQLNRIIKPNGAIVLFGSEPFSSALRMSNIKNYKYDWIWYKNTGSNFAQLKRQPLRVHETISIFNKSVYYAQQTQRKSQESKKRLKSRVQGGGHGHSSSIKKVSPTQYNSEFCNPRSVIEFKSVPNANGKLHQTQKPIALMEYLIKTYTNENETVLDFTMGSGTTMVACQNTNRNGIGIEKDKNYFEIAKKRIEENKYKLF
jgi:site-specific DNA-methyltransferase (adenine-specific)